MTAFADELRHRVETARRSLAEARREGDEYLVQVRVGELEELARAAAVNGVDVPGLAEDLAAHRDADVLDLPEDLPEDDADD